jgi:hypothetical protein
MTTSIIHETAATEERGMPLAADETAPQTPYTEEAPDATVRRTTPIPTSLTPIQSTYVHPSRIRRPPEKLNLYSVYHMTARRALKENPGEALPIIRQELETLLRKGVFRGRDYASLTENQRKGIIRSQMNVTQKYAPSSDGNGRVKDKLKARLVYIYIAV